VLASTVTSETDAAQDRRAGRYAARHTLWSQSDLPRVRSCGRAPQKNDVGVQVKVTHADGKRHAGLSNVQHCASAWACPVCSAVISAERQGDISAALSAWYVGDGVESFGKVALVTLTMRHNKGHSLKALWDALSEAWNLVGSGAGWAADQLAHGERYVKMVVKSSGPRPRPLVPKLVGRIPLIRVVEVTYGVFGWHVHIHAILLLPMSASDASVERLSGSMYGRWAAGLKARGLSSQRYGWRTREDGTKERFDLGVDARLIHGDPSAALGEYFVKAVYSTSMEVARFDMKKANHGNRTPFAVLADVVDQERAIDAAREDLAIWHEYERGSKGRKQIVWSYGLRARLLPAKKVVELSDQEIADRDHGGDVVVELNADLWKVITTRRADWRLIKAFELSDADGYSLLWEFAAAAELESARQWAELLEQPDPLRRVWQTRESL